MEREKYYSTDAVGKVIRRIKDNMTRPEPSACSLNIFEVYALAMECERLRLTYGYDENKRDPYKPKPPIPLIGQPEF